MCLAAAKELQDYITGDSRLRADADRGKMFGVLVVETADGRTGYLAAFSGLLAGSNDHALSHFFFFFSGSAPNSAIISHEPNLTGTCQTDLAAR